MVNSGKTNKESQQMDYLGKMLNKQDSISDDVREIKNSVTNMVSGNPLDYLLIDIGMLPLGRFYRHGTKIGIRAAKVSEVQAYSVVDNRNPVDVTDKMNHILASCVRFTNPNGSAGSYRDIKDGDRLFLVFMIRELTFQKGPSIQKDVTCQDCKTKFSIPFRATNSQSISRTFELNEMPDIIADYFDEDNCCFEFKFGNATWRLAPPTIGIQEDFFKDIQETVKRGETPNASFLKIIPYTLWDRNSITSDGIKAKLDEFENRFDITTFQFLNTAVEKMVFGLKGLVSTCPECGSEVRTEMTFPGGASGIFVLPSIFDEFIGK